MNSNLINFVRKILRDNKFDLAKSIIEVVEREYPFLKFEFSILSGDFESAREIFNLLDYKYKEFYGVSLFEKEVLIEELENAINRVYNSLDESIDFNSIKEEYPEVVELISLELKNAIRKNDKENIQYLKELLKNFDPNTDLKVENNSASQKSLNVLVMGISIIILIFTVISLFNPTIFSLKNSIENLNLKIDTNFERLNTKVFESNNRILDEVSNVGKIAEKGLEEIKTIELENAKNLLLKLSEIEDKLMENKEKPEEKAVELFNSIDPNNIETLRFLWLMGYEYYKQKNYLMSLNLLEFVIDKSLALNFKDLYFLDDAFYYRALIYYEIGDFERAYSLFNDFIERFPKSIYVKHSKYFINRLGGIG
ncbi:hypothetical protein SU69_09050 [Thermosipho melanesiensis]|uniref:Tetratricopeptide TPR_2 repeat protein n=2 Tax=Thermosipho melanesiensis TaxID=46541 RepID=A6LNX6_THEM4|nr:tetratricopeptide repeat protein [Thermosipho melanesiensis]ABR31627.1 Tetratricopeptide TPR_2 repeat protein [Thermosipho melanesiensis BI429]APT74656.1 hypothetical protein BW47_09430 [Thermosipho melanesiensis]OOC35155.1 hypothetical protein SU69_09050 [Thermosipho melanesiensis]OOC35365.1 hypothetical protein SU70_09060 [Thermosipho melanesiensis]OOC36616.1 hypothetical protein SU68_09120 [Thermosipho melanesiensis]